MVTERIRHVFYDTDVTELASMATNDLITTEGLLNTERATSTLTESSFNMTVQTDVVPKLIIIQLAMDSALIHATHVGNKTFYLYDITGTLSPI